MKKLHPGTIWSFRLGGLIIAVFLSFILGWFIIPVILAISKIFYNTDLSLTVAIVTNIVYIIIIIIFIETYARLSYSNWRYDFGQSNLKTERGIIWKRYSNVPYERVQNVDVTRGIIARIFGFSTLNVQTAGFSGQHAISEGYIPGVSIKEAENIREFLLKKITKNSKAGI